MTTVRKECAACHGTGVDTSEDNIDGICMTCGGGGVITESQPTDRPYLPPEFFMPVGAESHIPPNWIVENNDGWLDVTVPSWGTGPQRFYKVRMLKENRQLFCECPGFKYHQKCHHIPYLIGFVNKGAKQRGVQDTSIEAFFNIQSDLGRCRRLVLEVIRKHGPISNAAIAASLGWAINRITPRVKELRSLEVPLVEDAGKALDPITHKTVHVWRATGALL